MRYVRVAEAGRIAGVSAATLRSWEARFGIPVAERSEGGHRRYQVPTVLALRDALREGLTSESACLRAMELVSSGIYTDPPDLRARMSRLEDGLHRVELALLKLADAVSTVRR